MHKTRFLLAISGLLLASLACSTLLPAAEPTATTMVNIGPTSTMVVIVEPTFPPTQSDLPASEAGVPRVSLEETLTALAAGAATVVDVRSPGMFELSHIEGSINIPLGEIEINPTGLALDKDEWIITYCT